MIPLLSIFIIIAILKDTIVQAHMQLYYPPPFAAANNPHVTDTPYPYLDYPYNCCGSKTPFPCKGFLNHLNTTQGQPVVSWPAGSGQNFSLTGSGNHYGGSCQVGFSVDEGKSWRVVKSFEGNCPYRDGGTDPEKQTFRFRVPNDTPVGKQVFAWTWVNREQEFNMLCAAVRITAPEGDVGSDNEGRRRRMWIRPDEPQHHTPDTPICWCRKDGSRIENPSNNITADSTGSANNAVPSAGEAISFSDRPSFLFANINNGCWTPKANFELKYPNPGPDVMQGDGEYQLKLPEPPEKCG
ncbi:hypothetical protein GX48_07192 [Paracoccidioides brasiliensis]|nr:hypothetical protein GX48_07192 [Paracoccidioides brasiliensis]